MKFHINLPTIQTPTSGTLSPVGKGNGNVEKKKGVKSKLHKVGETNLIIELLNSE